VALTTHPHLGPRLKKSRAIPLLPFCTSMTNYRGNFTFLCAEELKKRVDNILRMRFVICPSPNLIKIITFKIRQRGRFFGQEDKCVQGFVRETRNFEYLDVDGTIILTL
jgi:hypothetical protein